MMAEPSESIFDLRGRANQVGRYYRRQNVFVWAVLAWFVVLGLFILYWKATHTVGPVTLGMGIACIAVGLAMMVFWTNASRAALEARLSGEGILWVPNRGAATTTRWDDPRLRITLVDWRSNRLRPPALRGPNDVVVVASGLFGKFVTPSCFEAILASARSRGLHIDDSVRDPGTRTERRVILITRSA